MREKITLDQIQDMFDEFNKMERPFTKIKVSPNDYNVLRAYKEPDGAIDTEFTLSRLYGYEVILDVTIEDGKPELC